MLRGLKIIIILSLLGLTILAIAYWHWQNEIQKPIIDQEQIFLIERGESLSKIARRLSQKTQLSRPEYVLIYAQLYPEKAQIKAGEYRLQAGMSLEQILNLFRSGKSIDHRITIIEGWTFKQMMAHIRAHPILRQELADLSPEQIMAAIGHAGEHPEGRFFPTTYYFNRGYSDQELLKRAYDLMQQKLEQAWQQRQPDLPLNNAYEALILASIIEKETALDAERRQIAGVFIRRLKKGMRLQTDPTVIYGMGEAYQGNIRKRDLRQPTPYNTYIIKGLPPTPICLPGEASLKAAVNPAAGDALYFVAKGDGSHVFSKNLKEHNRAVRQYQLR